MDVLTIFLHSVKGGLVWSFSFFTIWSLFALLLKTKKSRSSFGGAMSLAGLFHCAVGVSWALWIVTVEKTKFGEPLTSREQDFILFSLSHFLYDCVVKAIDGQTSVALHHVCCMVAEACALYFEASGGEILWSFIVGEAFVPLLCIIHIAHRAFDTSRFDSLMPVFKVGFFVGRGAWLALGIFFVLPGNSGIILKFTWTVVMEFCFDFHSRHKSNFPL